MTASSLATVGRVPRAAPSVASGPAGLAIALVFLTGAALVRADESALRLRATPVGAATGTPLSIELSRWSTETERGPLLAALAPPAPAPTPPVSAAPPAAGRAAGRAAGAGRGGRGARGGGGAARPSPLEQLTGAVKAAPTVGYIWGGITGYSIRYAWHAPAADGAERVVLVIDRRLDALPTAESQTAGEFTLIEMLLDHKGAGEAKTSLTTAVVVDAAAQTLALDGYRAAPTLLKVTR